jgi:hypothetical protein
MASGKWISGFDCARECCVDAVQCDTIHGMLEYDIWNMDMELYMFVFLSSHSSLRPSSCLVFIGYEPWLIVINSWKPKRLISALATWFGHLCPQCVMNNHWQVFELALLNTRLFPLQVRSSYAATLECIYIPEGIYLPPFIVLNLKCTPWHCLTDTHKVLRSIVLLALQTPSPQLPQLTIPAIPMVQPTSVSNLFFVCPICVLSEWYSL